MTNTPHANDLTPAEQERLAMLIEECGEVITAATKILRHGYESYHPDRPGVTNRDDLRREVTDVRAVLLLIGNARDLPMVDVADVSTVAQKKLRFTHHQARY